MNNIVNAYKIKSVLSLHTQKFFLSCLVQEKNKNKVSAWLFETLTNSKNCSIAGFPQWSVFSVNVDGRHSEQFLGP